MNFFFVLLITCLVHVTVGTTMDLVWMIDDSSSIKKSNYNRAKNMIRRINTLVAEDYEYGGNNTGVALVEFGTRVTGVQPLTTDLDEFNHQLECNRYGDAGKTKTSKAFRYVNENILDGNKTSDKRVIVIVTDGAPNPARKYGGITLEKRVNESFTNHGVDDLIYVMVSNSVGKRGPLPDQFTQVTSYYNKTTDFVSVNFRKKVSYDIEYDIYSKIVGYDVDDIINMTDAPSIMPPSYPTASPTTDDDDDYYSYYDANTTMSPTIPTSPPSQDPTTLVTSTQAPTSTPTTTTSAPPVSDGVSGGVIAGIVAGVLVVGAVGAAVVYSRGVES